MRRTRHFNGHTYYQYAKYGAHGAGNKAQGRRDAQETADDLRLRQGKLARVTLEHLEYGTNWVVWEGPKRKGR